MTSGVWPTGSWRRKTRRLDAVTAFARVVTAQVPAKVNLSLAVGPLRPDGFHDLATVYQAVSVFDEVEVRRRSAGSGLSLSVEGDDEQSVPIDESNLAWQAAVMVAQEADTEPDVHIHIRKAIPVAGGMAGGSADAAGALVACDVLWRANLHRERLTELAGALGSDVAFALHGGTAVGTGRGEVVTPAMARGEYVWVFAVAEKGLSTPRVYQECDRLRTGRPVAAPQVPEALMEGLLAGDAVAVGAALCNDLQPAAVSLRPELDIVMEVGRDGAALGTVLSGSGPTVAFLVADDDAALDLAVSLSASGFCRGVLRAKGPAPGARVREH